MDGSQAMAKTPVVSARPRTGLEGATLAKTRERFLTADPVDAESVRDTILASWWRSRRWNVAPDHVNIKYVQDPDLDTPLSRSALPILEKLVGHLEGQPIAVILTDADGLVLTRLTADTGLDHHLDLVQLAPGFCYAEKFVGTNGIGTALEGGRAMHVFGHEHYAENLEDLACAAVPIQHPITGKTVGAVDLTCWRRDAGQLLIALAKTTSDQIRQALLMDGGEREYQLLQAYLRACRRSTGIVFALNGDVVMMNDHAQLVLEAGDQAALLQQATESLATGRAGTVVVDLPSGSSARMQCRPVGGGGRIAGGVAQVKLIEAPQAPAPAARLHTRMFLPGVVGSGALWLRACHQVDAAHASGEWLVLEGEGGVGKVALARAVHQRRCPAGRFHVLDAAEYGEPTWLGVVRRELDEEDGLLVIRHVDRLPGQQLRALAAVVQEAGLVESALRVIVTVGVSAPGEDLLALLAQFPRTVRVPPLRHHIEDLPALVPFVLARLQDNRVICSPAAMQLLIRSTWPGNTAQLVHVLREVVQHRRSGVIEPDDLPPECRTVSRRLLSPIEALERDAIVNSLLDCQGNKVAAATALGMSRATIYRKIHEYGIVSSTS
jgi:sigma-54 dependent transcriptional regulator, acetoin dehydrogenase operon transcriptional activator AcoR